MRKAKPPKRIRRRNW